MTILLSVKRATLGKRGSATRGLAAILTGTALGQVVAFAASPVLTRLFTPAEFGVFSVIAGLATILTSAVSLRIDRAIPLPDSDGSAYALLYLGAASTAISAVVLTPAIALLPNLDNQLSGMEGASAWLWVVPALAGSMSFYQLLNALAVRQQRYTAIARRNLLQSTATVASQIGAGVFGYKTGGLLLGIVLGQLVGVVSLALGSALNASVARQARTVDQIRAAASRYRQFPLTLTPAGILNTLGAQGGLLALGTLYGTSAAGWFGLTQRVLAVPLTLVGQAVAQVYLSELAKTRRERTGREASIFWSTSRRLGAVGALGALVLVLAGPALFEAVFGTAWASSGQMAQALGILLAFQLVASPVSQTLVVYERVAMQLVWDAGRLIVVVASILICAKTGQSAVVATWAYAGTSVLAYAVSWELSRRVIASAP